MKIRETIYLDHQASTPVHDLVLTAMAPFCSDSIGNPHSADHILGWQADQAVKTASTQIASIFEHSSDEIVFTSGATEANNQAILGVAIAARGSSRNRIIVSSTDHKCVLAAAQASHEIFGLSIQHAPVDRLGCIDLNWLESNLDDDVLLVSAISVNNEIGTIQDLKIISELAHNVGALVHSDCAQAPLATSLSNIACNVDMLSLSAHKFYGPKGIGALYVERSVKHRVSPIIFGGGQQQNFRSGTVPTFLVVGMAKAIELFAGEDGAKYRSYLRHLRGQFIACLRRTGIEIEVLTPTDSEVHPSNANIRFIGVKAHDILHSLQPRVAASTGSACASGTLESSHVLRAIGLTEQEAEECIRFSVGLDTTEADVEEAASIIAETIAKLSAIGCVA